MTNSVFIVNPQSGAGKTGKLWPKLLPVVEKNFPGFKAVFTTRPLHAKELAIKAVESGAKTIISVGGDGTHNEIINGLFKDKKTIAEDLTFGVLPLGTGGDFRRTLGLPRNSVDALNQIGKNSTINLDVGVIECKDFSGADSSNYFVNVASVGFTAMAAQRTNQSTKKFGGLASYCIGTLKTLREHKPFKSKVTSGDKVLYDGKTTDISIANGRYFGGGYLVSPHSKLSDGLLNVIVIKKMSLTRLTANIHKLFFGTHLKHPRIMHHPIPELLIEGGEDNTIIEGDGEAVGTLPCKIQCCEDTIKVLVGDSYGG